MVARETPKVRTVSFYEKAHFVKPTWRLLSVGEQGASP
jgi:hypothetical protein